MLKALRTSGPQSANELAAALANRGRAIRPDTIQVALGEFVAAELVAGAGEDGQQRWLALPTARDPLLEAVDLHGAHDFRQRTKRYFREPPGRRRTHVHVRRAGSFSEQRALLFRDYLRAHPAVAAEYEADKRTLAIRFRDDRHGYTEAKGPTPVGDHPPGRRVDPSSGVQPEPSDA